MIAVLATFLLGVAGLGAAPTVAFKASGAPFRFEYAKGLHATSRIDADAQAVFLRDYAQDDDYRAFLIEVRSRPMPADLTMASAADAIVAELQKKAGASEVLVVDRREVRFHGQPAIRLELDYLLAGGEREAYVRPDGKERRTGDHPLQMRREAIVTQRGPAGDRLVTLVLTTSREQHPRRRPMFEDVLRTFADKKPRG